VEQAQNEHTVQALYDRYRTHQEKTLRSWSEVRRIMEREVLPVWRHCRVVDLHRRGIRELVERKARTAPIQANRVLQRISGMLSFAVDQDWIESNPAWRIKKPGRERSRDRVLTREELREVWAALHETEATNPDGTPKARLSQTLNDMLLTTQRRGEVYTMCWQDIDLVTGWWMIPAESSRTLIRTACRSRRWRWRFSSDGPRPRTATSATSSRIIDRRASSIGRRRRPRSCAMAGCRFHFRAHDLRRTAASYMGESGVDRFHIAHVLNHRSVTHSTVTAVYDRYRHDKEKRAALEKWAEVLSGIVEVKPAPATAPAARVQRQNVYDFKPRALRRAGDQAGEVGCAPTQSA
jgi:integrase